MNKQTIISLFLVLFFQISAQAQDCDCMRKYKKGTRFQIIKYDKKGKVVNASDELTEVFDKIPNATGWELQWGFTPKDKKGNNGKKLTFRTRCENGVYLMDIKQNILLPTQDDSQDNKVSFRITGDPLRLPVLEVGKEQTESNLEYATMLDDIALMKVKVRSFNMKVVGIETITTPAGTFECYKITYDTELKALGTRKGSTTLYINKDYGQVKTIVYDNKGKEESRYELSKFVE